MAGCAAVLLAQMMVVPALAAGLPQLLSDVQVTDLRCEYLADPLGIDAAQPRLSWKLESQWRGQTQTAYEVLVATDRRMLDEPGRPVGHGQSHVRPVHPRPLRRQTALVAHTVLLEGARLGQGRQSHARSASRRPGRWACSRRRTGRGKWISMRGEGVPPLEDKSKSAASPEEKKEQGQDALATKDKSPQPAPLFRKGFILAKQPVRARVYICGLGYYELRVNGAKVGDHVLDPAFTRYDRRALYVTYDVTDLLKKGPNALGVILGNGWYNMHTRCVWDFDKAPWRDRPVLLCQLELTFEDGSKRVIASDATWRVTTGPIVFDSIRNGETYDARLEKAGWDTAEYDDMNWPPAEIVSGPKGELAAQMLPPIKVTKTFKPAKLTQPKPGVYVFDTGQNMAGWTRLRVSGPAGTEIVLKYGERLNPDGTLDQKEIGQHIKTGKPQTDTYILKGQGTEVWEPRFAYYGFQYVEVTGLPGKPDLNTLEARVVHTSFERAGSFECSNDLLNRIQQNTLWSYISNFLGYPTDCPHREKNGWTGDAHLAAETGLYNFHSAPAYAKWLNDLKDEQRPSGELPGIVPTSGWGYQWGNGPAWDSAYVLIPWYLTSTRVTRGRSRSTTTGSSDTWTT